MNFADLSLVDLLGTFMGFVLTLCVFSYLLGDNVLFRLATHVFVGVSAGYVAVMVGNQVLWPLLVQPLLTGNQEERWRVLIPAILGVLLLFKVSPRTARLGNPALAYLVGVGAAAAIGGAILGTMFPQVGATANAFDLRGLGQLGENPFLGMVNGGILLVGTITTLAYFHFSTRSDQGASTRQAVWMGGISWIGRMFIAVTFGVLFAGALVASLTALIERLDFLLRFVLFLLGIKT